VSESAVSAKRSWFLFGAKPAQSETPAGAAQLSGVHPEEAEWEKNGEAHEFRKLRLLRGAKSHTVLPLRCR
jgi:hypothetical protein